MKPAEGVHLVFGPFRFDPKSGLLFEGGSEIVLPPRAAAILTSLLQAPGEMVSKEDLIAAGWSDTAVSDQSLTEAVKLLRQALRDDPKEPGYIQTLRGRGYRFIATVRPVARDAGTKNGWVLSDETPVGGSAAAQPASGPTQPAGRPRWGRRLSIAAPIVLALAIGGAWLVWTFLAGQLADTEHQLERLEQKVDTALGSGNIERKVWDGDAEFSGSPSPDGNYIAYVNTSFPYQLCLYETDTGTRRQLTSYEPPMAVHRDGHEIFSPDGGRIAYVVWNMDADIYEMHVVALDDAPDAVASTVYRGTFIVAHTWTHDGRSVLAARQGDGVVEIVQIAVGDGADSADREPMAPIKLTELTGTKDIFAHGPRTISLSPRGDAIAYDVPQGSGTGNRDIHLLSLLDGHDDAIVEHPSNDHSPLWTPDGEQLVFVSNRRDLYGLFTVRIADREVAEAARLRTPGRGWNVRLLGLTTDGSLYYGSGFGMTGSDIHIAPLEQGTFVSAGPPLQVTPATPGQNLAPSWAPDGTGLAYVSTRGSLFDYDSAIVVNSVDGSQGTRRNELTTELGFIRQPDWSPDGSFILTKAVDPTDVAGFYLIDMRGGETARLLRGGVNFRSPRWSADGKSFLYLRRSRETVQNPENGEGQGVFVYRILQRDVATSGEAEDREIHRVVAPDSIDLLRLSPNGEEIGYLRESNLRSSSEWSWSIEAMPRTGAVPTPMLSGSDPEWYVSDWLWTPDGRGVLFVKARSGVLRVEREIWIHDLATGNTEPIGISMPGIQTLAIDPAGSRIAFAAATQPPSSDIWILPNFLPVTPATGSQ